MILDFIKENWLYLVIVAGVIVVMTLTYIIYTLAGKMQMKKYNRDHQEETPPASDNNVISLQDLIDQEIISSYESKNNKKKEADSKDSRQTVVAERPGEKPDAEKTVDPQAANTIVSPPEPKPEPTPVLEAAPRPEVKMEPSEASKAPNQKAPDEMNPRPVKQETKPKAEQTGKKELGKYHVLYRKEDQKWFVRREGSDRILRVLETQREAIAYATIKALTQDTSLVIHKQDGKIRKQN